MIRLVVSLSDGADPMAVERAIAEFRSGRPVLIDGEDGRAIAVGVEDLDDPLAAGLDAVAGGLARLVLPPARLRRLGVDRE